MAAHLETVKVEEVFQLKYSLLPPKVLLEKLLPGRKDWLA